MDNLPTIDELEEIEKSNARALATINRIRDIGVIRDELLTQLDAYFALKDCCPELLSEERPIRTQWIGKGTDARGAQTLELKITNSKGECTTLPESLVPAIIKRPEGVTVSRGSSRVRGAA